MSLAFLDTRWRLSAAVLLVSVAVVSATYGVLSATVLDTDYDFSPGSSIPVSEDDVVVATVGGQPLFLFEFNEYLWGVEAREIYMQEQIDSDTEFADYVIARREQTAGFGPANATLAGLIMESALYQHAVKGGYSASESRVNQNMTAARAAFEDGRLGDGDGQLADPIRRYIDAAGENRFWSEIYLSKVYRSLTIGIMRQSLTKQYGDDGWEIPALGWLEFEKDTLADADVTLINAESIRPATLENAIEFLQAVRDFERSYLAPTP